MSISISRNPPSCIGDAQQSKYRLFDTDMEGTRDVTRKSGDGKRVK